MSSLEGELKRIRIAADRLRLRLGDREMHEVFGERIAAIAEWLEMADCKVEDDDLCRDCHNPTWWDVLRMVEGAEGVLIRAFTRE